MTFVPSKYQTAIFDGVQHDHNNMIVEAVAGSGKTTTIVKAMDLLGMEGPNLFCAFNKHIADELSSRAPMTVQVSTLNSLGYKILRQKFGYCNIDQNKTRNILWFDIFHKENYDKYIKTRRTVEQLVSLCKAFMFFAPTVDDLDFLCERYLIFHEDIHDIYALVCRVLNLNFLHTKVIDFDDQLAMPVHFELDMTEFANIFVDETQDLNRVQVELLRRSLSKSGRIVAVGDSRQAIYGFRGADPESMERVKTGFGAVELPLSVCYRCPKAVVIEARSIVPQIEYCDSAEEGIVDEISVQAFYDMRQDGDWVLCRTTAPLVQEALKLIRKKKKAIVRGRDLGQNLIDLANGHEDLEEYYCRRLDLSQGIELAVMALRDQIDTIYVLWEEYGKENIEQAVNEVFGDSTDGVTFCTIHRAKGLETDRVFLLHPELLPHPKCKTGWTRIQEDNLKYIAITRAKKEFYYVYG